MAESAATRGSRALDFLSALPAKRWFAYTAVLLVQARAMWGIWNKDLTSGDTSSYFANSVLWSDGLQVNFAWSPLYTSFLGTVDWIVGSTIDAVVIHRVLIVLALAVVVLAVLRRLVPAWAALLGACWWASLPIIYDSLYEVHLFAALPLLVAVWLLTNEPSVARRGAAIGFLVASAILVRNEAGFVAVLLLAAMAVSEWRAHRRGEGIPLKKLAVSFGVPVLIAAAAIGLTFERSAVKGETLSRNIEMKHTLNVCQVYTFNYQQRHPREYTGSPWTECQPFMASVFDEPLPSLTDAWRQNPSAMLDFTTWNARLLPQGIQVALFNAAAGNLNPDYAQQRLGAWWAGVLSILLGGVLIAGAVVLRRDWDHWGPMIKRQRWAWLALAAIALIVVAVVVFTQRPRPSYMFGMTAGIMALAMLAAAVLVRRFRLQRWASAGVALLPAVLIVALPVHFEDGPRPVATAHERLEPVLGETPEEVDPVLVSRGHTVPLCRYLVPQRRCEGIPFGGELSAPGADLQRELEERGATIIYADEAMTPQASVQRFIEDHEGWEIAGEGSSDMGEWAVLERKTG